MASDSQPSDSSGNTEEWIGDDAPAELKELQTKASRAVDFYRAQIKERYSDNPFLDQMINSIAFTVECLSNPDSRTRLLAIHVFSIFFLSIEIGIYLPQFERLAFTDPDIEVRRSAFPMLAHVVNCHDQNTRNATGRRIAKVVLDTSADSTLRMFAYKALCTLSSKPEVRRKGFEQLKFPDDADWHYVRSWQ